MIADPVRAGVGFADETAFPARRCGSYHPRFRQAVEETAAVSGAVADLTESFPALLFAIATGYATREARADAIRLVVAGAPLRAAAHVLDLPFWTRRLPPEALTEPLAALPSGSDQSQRLASLVPNDGAAAASWLSSLQLGMRCCHEGFGLWTASWAAAHHRALATAHGEQTLRWLAAWAWHADRRDTLGYRLLRRPWTPAMGYRRALDELVVWRQRLVLAVVIEAGGSSTRLADGHAQGYDFVRLSAAEDFVAEADVMDNCLDQFADRLLQGYSRVYSIRRKGRSVADVEIGLHEQEACMPTIRQLRGPRNRRAPPAVWQAAYAWLGAQALAPVYPQDWRLTPARLRSAARACWAPYLAHLDESGQGEAAEAFRALALAPAALASLDERLPEPQRRPRARAAPGSIANA